MFVNKVYWAIESPRGYGLEKPRYKRLKDLERSSSMIEANEIEAIELEKIYENQLKVKRAGKAVFKIIGYSYGDQELKFVGKAPEVAGYLNSYFGKW